MRRENLALLYIRRRTAIRFEFVDGFGALSAWFSYIRTLSGVVSAGPSGITDV